MDDLREASFPFPIADIEDGPSVSYSSAELVLRFVDYTKTPREVVFKDVTSFRVSSIDADTRKLWDDRTYIVDDSALIRRLVEAGDIDDPKFYMHRIIPFNETGQYLEIVYREMEPNAT